ncbi:alpha-2,8-sialyltransferase 8F isoform X2 [Xenopus laevis]|uniref:Alpha-2,8-sialyltransferase 8F isoform X2 n=1 Tax=Xenopus laevis TaxID=8355 RepID=A0A8J1L1H5_XENLA|nr:alpha-2,8-sialyltransferase 8F isoform X2 [Xenopus laevis]
MRGRNMKKTLFLLLGTSLLLFILTVWLSIGESARYRSGTVTSRVGLVKPELSYTVPSQSNYTTSPVISSFCRDVEDRLLTVSLKKRYSEDYYIQTVNELQNCTWQKRPQEYSKFRLYLSTCCNGLKNFIVSQNNTSLGSNITYEVESKKKILIAEEIYRMFPKSQPFVGAPFKQCAVVGNGGILANSGCGAEIDQSDFVFRCNLPPTWGNISVDVGNKTNLVTVNPSIISRNSNTAISFEVHRILEKNQAKQKAIFFHPYYLKNLAQFWKGRGVRAYRLSTGLMITSAAIELCEEVKLYGFWPFSKNQEGKPISHHYYDNILPKPGFHAMPKEFYQVLQLHHKGVLRLQIGKCEKR